MKIACLFLLLIALGLSACSPSSDPVPKIADGQREALDKAKALESDLQQSAEQRQKQLDQE